MALGCRIVKTSTKLEHVQCNLGFFRHAARVPGRIKYQIDLNVADTGDRRDGIFNPYRHFTCNRTARRSQGHVDLDIAVIINVDPVNQSSS